MLSSSFDGSSGNHCYVDEQVSNNSLGAVRTQGRRQARRKKSTSKNKYRRKREHKGKPPLRPPSLSIAAAPLPLPPLPLPLLPPTTHHHRSPTRRRRPVLLAPTRAGLVSLAAPARKSQCSALSKQFAGSAAAASAIPVHGRCSAASDWPARARGTQLPDQVIFQRRHVFCPAREPCDESGNRRDDSRGQALELALCGSVWLFLEFPARLHCCHVVSTAGSSRRGCR